MNKLISLKINKLVKNNFMAKIIGINLANVASWSTEKPFCNVFDFSRKWVTQRNGAWALNSCL